MRERPTLEFKVLRNIRVFQEAFEEGRLEGREEGKLEMIPEFLELGWNLEQIAKVLKLEIDVVRQAAQKGVPE